MQHIIPRVGGRQIYNGVSLRSSMGPARNGRLTTCQPITYRGDGSVDVCRMANAPFATFSGKETSPIGGSVVSWGPNSEMA